MPCGLCLEWVKGQWITNWSERFEVPLFILQLNLLSLYQEAWKAAIYSCSESQDFQFAKVRLIGLEFIWRLEARCDKLGKQLWPFVFITKWHEWFWSDIRWTILFLWVIQEEGQILSACINSNHWKKIQICSFPEKSQNYINRGCLLRILLYLLWVKVNI